MGWLSAAIGAAGSLAGSIFGAQQARRNAAEQHDWAVEDAATSRSWQERMSNTAHQREVADLRAAGLNPILSAGGGPGASTPSGATADSEAADTPDYSRFAATAIEAKLATAQTKLMKAQEEQASSASEFNKAAARKTKREGDIIGPKATVMEKFKESLENVARDVKDMSGIKTPEQKKRMSDDALRIHLNRGGKLP